MFSKKPTDTSNPLSDRAAEAADHAIKAGQRVANDALDGLSGTVQDMRHQAAPLLNRVSEQAASMTEHGVHAIRDSAEHLRERAVRASDSTLNYVKHEPVKAVLIAAATGALLMAALSLMTRPHGRG